MDDTRLIAKTISGDSQAYRMLVEKYQAPLLRYVTFLIHDRDLAQDVVQETFIKAYRNLRGYNPKHKFSSWIYRIAHNAAMDTLPKRPQTSLDDDVTYTDMYLAIEDTTAQQLDREFATQHVAECLTELDIKYREPIALLYLEHKSYDEISEVLHISVSSVGVRINRAKKKLRSICMAKGVTS